MDPLSAVLSTLQPQSALFAGLQAGRDWALSFPQPDGIKFNAVVAGRCWLNVAGMANAVALDAGDCFLLTQPLAFALASDPNLPTTPAAPLHTVATSGIARHGSADAFFLVGGRFTFAPHARLLFEGLPPVIVIRHDSEPASLLRWALPLLARELAQPAPGSELTVQQLGQLMLVQALRLHLGDTRQSFPSWLRVLADGQLAPAIRAIHADPARRWTVAELAATARMSRSTLALKFKLSAGLGPLEYLTRWRMLLATTALTHGQQTVSAIAAQLGYLSDSAFSHAFRRVLGQSPRAYRALTQGERTSARA